MLSATVSSGTASSGTANSGTTRLGAISSGTTISRPTSAGESHQSLVKLRSLGPLERYLATWSRLRFYLNVGVTAYYTSPLIVTLSLESAIFAALASLISRQPILSCIPIDEDKSKPYFARLPTINLRQIVTFVVRQRAFSRQDEVKDGDERDKELDELLQWQHNTPFEGSTTPFWRVMIVINPRTTAGFTAEPRQNFIATFIFHHALAGGTSGVLFHQEFLKALNTELMPLANTTIKTPDLRILPEMERLVQFEHTLSWLAKSYWNDKFPKRREGFWTGAPVTEAKLRHFRSRSFPPDVTEGLIKKCKEQKTTVQAALQVLVAESLFRILPRQFVRLNCIIPVDLRRWCDSLVEETSMGAWISSTEETYVRKNDGLGGCDFDWDHVRRSRENILQYLAMKGKNDEVELLGYLGDRKKFCLSKLGKERGGSFEVSNLGRIEYEEKTEDQMWEGEQWKMGRMVFGQSAGVMSAAVLVTVITGGDGRMTLGFAWQEEVVESEVIERLILSLGNRIQDLVAQDSA